MTSNENLSIKKPLAVELFTKGLSVLIAGVGLAAILMAFYVLMAPLLPETFQHEILLQIGNLYYAAAFLIIGGLALITARGFWRYRNWARVLVLIGLLIFILYYFVTIVFAILTTIFAGLTVVPFAIILRVVGMGLLFFLINAGLPIVIMVLLVKVDQFFIESARQREFVEQTVRYVLLGSALSAVIIVILIFVFTFNEAWESITLVGLDTMLLGTIWRPGSIIGNENPQLGLVPMILGTILSTIGAVVIGVPLSVGTAVLLAEVAPPSVREIFRPAVELLAGIPSVVYGLFGMVVMAPLIRNIDVPRNTGFGLLNASIILAVMIIPTVTSIAEDAIRAVPREYKEGSLALGGTHWQTITRTILPAARSGILAAIILGIGRALGETMAMIMVIGNSIAVPRPLTDNPFTIILNTARTLTGNIAVEINYAAGPHRSALFFTGVLLFLMILIVNSVARLVMRSNKEA